jgi:RNA-binding protein
VNEIIRQVLHGKPHIHIGKFGITEAVINQIKTQYKTKNIIKIKFLSIEGFPDMKIAVHYLANVSNSKVLDIRGKTCILQKN